MTCVITADLLSEVAGDRLLFPRFIIVLTIGLRRRRSHPQTTMNTGRWPPTRHTRMTPSGAVERLRRDKARTGSFKGWGLTWSDGNARLENDGPNISGPAVSSHRPYISVAPLGL